MPHVLEMFQLAHQHGVPKMQVGRGGIEAGFHAHGLAGGERLLEALAQVALANDLGRAFAQVGQLFASSWE